MHTHRSSAQANQRYTSMCRPLSSKRLRAQRAKWAPSYRSNARQIDRRSHIFKAGLQQWLLSNTTFTGIYASNHLHHALWAFLLYTPSFWHKQRKWGLSKKNAWHSTGPRRLVDDVLVFCKNKAEHDARLRTVLDRFRAANVTLNDNANLKNYALNSRATWCQATASVPTRLHCRCP